jgi:predicted nuclease of predicted toxin-antitoxin system
VLKLPIAARADLFPGSVHVQTLGFAGATADEVIWQYAREEDFTLLTSDENELPNQVRG